jgi:hypothetical protein
MMETSRLEKISALIEDAKIYKISDLWKRKPSGLKFNDTDALIVTLKTSDGDIIKETFYFCLKPDGTFNVDTVSKDGSHARRLRLARFLKHYIIKDNVREYNLKKEVENLRGKEVTVMKGDSYDFIYVP